MKRPAWVALAVGNYLLASFLFGVRVFVPVMEFVAVETGSTGSAGPAFVMAVLRSGVTAGLLGALSVVLLSCAARGYRASSSGRALWVAIGVLSVWSLLTLVASVPLARFVATLH